VRCESRAWHPTTAGGCRGLKSLGLTDRLDDVFLDSQRDLGSVFCLGGPVGDRTLLIALVDGVLVDLVGLLLAVDLDRDFAIKRLLFVAPSSAPALLDVPRRVAERPKGKVQ